LHEDEDGREGVWAISRPASRIEIRQLRIKQDKSNGLSRA